MRARHCSRSRVRSAKTAVYAGGRARITMSNAGSCGKQTAACLLAQPPPQLVAGHRRATEAGRDDAQPRMAVIVGAPENLEPGSAPAGSAGQNRLDLRSARQTAAPREVLGRQAAPCFEGIWTLSRRRPFLRRRLRTSRPQRVFMRARKPCLRMRRVLRGRYVGCIGRPRVSRKTYLGPTMGSRLTFPHWGGNIGRPVGPPPCSPKRMDLSPKEAWSRLLRRRAASSLTRRCAPGSSRRGLSHWRTAG